MTLLELLIVILLVGWLVGAFVVPVGGLIHVLLAIVCVLIIVRILQGRTVL
jgi:hypothetical protein